MNQSSHLLLSELTASFPMEVQTPSPIFSWVGLYQDLRLNFFKHLQGQTKIGKFENGYRVGVLA
jgi:hypothetical protein